MVPEQWRALFGIGSTWSVFRLASALALLSGTTVLVGWILRHRLDDSNGLVGNLVAEVVGVLAGTAFTLLVVDWVVRRAESAASVREAEGELMFTARDIAARTLWAFDLFDPRDAEPDLSEDFLRCAIRMLSREGGWANDRIAKDAQSEKPDGLLPELSPRLWEIFAIPVDSRRNLRRKRAVIELTIRDLDDLVQRTIPRLGEDRIASRAHGAVLAQFISVLRYNELASIKERDKTTFFGHMAIILWEILWHLTSGHTEVDHPGHGGHDEEVASTSMG